jgi:hypothetical protein
MHDPDTFFNELRKAAFAGGHRFAERIEDRLAAFRSAASRLEKAIPVFSSPQDMPALRVHLTDALLPAYDELANHILSPDEMAAAFRDWITDIDRTAQALPESVSSPEPARLYTASSADGPVTAVRKGAVRIVRKFGSPDDDRIRDVPVRDLGLALTREWLPVQFGKVLDDDRRRIARHSALLEKSFSDVFFAILRAENEWRLAEEVLPDRDALPETDTSPDDDGLATDGEAPAEAAPGHARLPASADKNILDVHFERLNDSLSRLTERLAETAEACESAAARDVERRIEQAWIPLESESSKAGSFMSDIPDVDDGLLKKRLARIDAQSEDWHAWKTRLGSRSSFFLALATLKNDLDLLVDGMEEGVARHLVQPIRERTTAVSARLQEAEERLMGQSDLTGQGLFDRRAGSFKALGDDAIRRVQEDLVEPIQEKSMLTRIPEENQAFLVKISELIERLPDAFHMHPLYSDPDDPVDPDEDARVVSLKDVVRNGTSDIDADQLEEGTLEARADLKETLENLVSLPSIVRFSFDSATGTDDDEDLDPDAAQDQDADQLLTMMQESLQRTRDAIGTTAQEIESSATMLVHVYRIQTLNAWTRIQDRLQVEHQVGAYVLDVRSRLDAEAREASQRLGRLTRRLRVLSERLLWKGHREARALIEKGKEAVGTPSPTRASFHDTALGLAELEQVLEDVPAVYRKLFSFQPLTDPDLLIGRNESRTFIENQLHQFNLGMPQASMLVGGPSSGRTSLLNVLQTTEFSDYPVRTLRLRERPDSPDALIRLLAESLELPVPDVSSVSEAARSLLDALDPEEAPICIVEHLEGLMLRGIGGYDLLVDMLQLMSLTDSRIIWIGTMSSFAWQLLKTADPDSAALVNVHAMTDLTREDLERLIMERHRKSGIPIEFIEPEDPSPLLRRKLRRVSSRDMRQQILKEAFFDRLFSQFGQNIQMALLQWIRSVRMSDDASSMRVDVTPALNLSFFSGFNMDQVFALKAILEHGTLSPDEYASVDRLPEDRALTLFETLGNALVIETTERRESGRMYRHSAVGASQQYRIRPLFSHAVIRLLQERNVVH